MDLGDLKNQLARLKRADDLGLELSNKIQAWSKANLDTKPQILKDRRGWFLELVVKNEPPLDEWSVIFSDAIGQLRNTLDNLVFSVLTPLAATDTHPDPKRIKFPIVKGKGKWNNEAKSIKHIPEPYYSRIESVQPFNDIKENKNGQANGLEILQSLSNKDKHNLQIIPMINTTNLNHEFSLEFMTLKEASMSMPPQIELLAPVFSNGAHLLRQKTKGRIESVNGHFRVQAQVMINVNEGQAGITQILSELWVYTANLLVFITGVGKKEFEDWANSL